MASGGLIVLAEDEVHLRLLYVAALNAGGFNVLTATDGTDWPFNAEK
jgi:DNA-binding response OmpR family regulator